MYFWTSPRWNIILLMQIYIKWIHQGILNHTDVGGRRWKLETIKMLICAFLYTYYATFLKHRWDKNVVCGFIWYIKMYRYFTYIYEHFV